jgi:tubulin polyglutamylase TTLL6/13
MYARAKKSKTFIVKPDASCQGRGIYLTKNVEDFGPTDDGVVQQYLAKVHCLNLDEEWWNSDCAM